MAQKKKDIAQSLTEQQKSKPADYTGGYADKIRQTMDSIIDRQPFSYDVNADKLYRQYRDNYTALGERAMKDTVGNAALLTGGYGNSYGVTAGQQAYNSYMQQLNEVVPQLEQQAYERWLNEGEELYDRLKALQGADNTEYDRYRDKVSDYYNDRDYERSVYESDRDYNYKKQQDALEQAYREKQFEREVYENDRDYQRKVYESDRKYMNDSLAQAVNSEKTEQNTEFSPAEAYEFLDKYSDVIYSDSELVESMYRMFGDKNGFFEWLSAVQVSGGDTGLDVLYRLHPELADDDFKREDAFNTAKKAMNASMQLLKDNKYNIITAGLRQKAIESAKGRQK